MTGSFENHCQNAELKSEIAAEMQRLAVEKKLSSLEKPKQFAIHTLPFDDDATKDILLTATAKLKRNVAKEYFKAQIDEMYAKIGEAEAA